MTRVLLREKIKMSDEKMDRIIECIEVGLRANQLLIRDRYFNLGNHEARAKIIDKQITDLLNPKRHLVKIKRSKRFAKKGSDEK